MWNDYRITLTSKWQLRNPDLDCLHPLKMLALHLILKKSGSSLKVPGQGYTMGVGEFAPFFKFLTKCSKQGMVQHCHAAE